MSPRHVLPMLYAAPAGHHNSLNFKGGLTLSFGLPPEAVVFTSAEIAGYNSRGTETHSDDTL